MDGLKQERFILPPADTLERAGLAGRARARKGAAALIVESLGHAELTRIDDLIVNNSDFGMTPLAWLRNFEEAPTTTNINGLMERLRYVRGIGIDPAIGTRVPDFRFAQFMREGGAAPAFLLSDYSLNRRRATLVAAVIDLDAKLADNAIQMFDRLVGSLFTRARRGRERRYQDSIRSVGELMRLFEATIDALGEAVEHGGNPLELIDEMVGWHRLVAAKTQVNALAELAGEDALVAATGRYATLRRFSPAFLDTFTFKASGSGSGLVKAIDIIRDANARKSRSLPEGIPLPFANRQWKRLITEGGQVDRRRYEMAVMATLRDRLRAGDIWVEGTRNYRCFDTYLLSRREAGKVADTLQFQTDAAAYMEERARTLDRRLRRFAKQFKANRLAGVALERHRLKLQPMPAITPPEAEALDRRLDALLPRVRITELLVEVAERTGFLSAFRDLRSGKEHDNPHAILAAILADGSNLGLERMANASDGVSYAQLAWTHNWYLSPENYQAALGMIVAAHHDLPFTRHWGCRHQLILRWAILPLGSQPIGGSRHQCKIWRRTGPEDLLPPVRSFCLVRIADHVGDRRRGSLCSRRPHARRGRAAPSRTLHRYRRRDRSCLCPLSSSRLPFRAPPARHRGPETRLSRRALDLQGHRKPHGPHDQDRRDRGRLG
ncbi:hypothetical protein WSK_2039 [Novosphingobium sp. Rr 2-17]|nr:hypothetical protein WSK_2039 [Novosphingobium sp. Rr 2-17]